MKKLFLSIFILIVIMSLTSVFAAVVVDPGDGGDTGGSTYTETCGNDYCGASEDCTSCSDDCGACITTDTGNTGTSNFFCQAGCTGTSTYYCPEHDFSYCKSFKPYGMTCVVSIDPFITEIGDLEYGVCSCADDNNICKPGYECVNYECLPEVTWYRDADGDGYGDTSITAVSGDQPSGYVSNNDDCDDSSLTIKPGYVQSISCTSNGGACSGTQSRTCQADGTWSSYSSCDAATYYCDTDCDGSGDTCSATSCATCECINDGDCPSDTMDCSNSITKRTTSYSCNTGSCDASYSYDACTLSSATNSVCYYDARCTSGSCLQSSDTTVSSGVSCTTCLTGKQVSGSTCYYGISCNSNSGWTYSNYDTNKVCAASTCTSIGWDNSGCAEICNNAPSDDDGDGKVDEYDSNCAINIDYNKNPVDNGVAVTATVRANDGSLYGASNVDIYTGGCSGTKVADSTSYSFTASSTTTYYGCLGSNSASRQLVIDPENDATECWNSADDDNDGEKDYDGFRQGTISPAVKGDDDCPVGVQNVDAPSTIPRSQNFNLYCKAVNNAGVTITNLRSVEYSIDSGSCTGGNWVSYNGDTYVQFSCSFDTVGTHNVGCTVNGVESYVVSGKSSTIKSVTVTDASCSGTPATQSCGECGTLTQVCDDGTWTYTGATCTGDTLNSETQACSTNSGSCTGTEERYCNLDGTWGSWQNCDAAINYCDTDCDGFGDTCSDAACLTCTCINGNTQSCYTGTAGTENVGDCHAGTQTCNSGNWGSCVGQVTPSSEICGGGDEDCDGTANEGCIICGNGLVEGTEECDDNNLVDGDGCDSSCAIEVDKPWVCVYNPGLSRSECTYCGDGLVLATEECDDGNAVNNDGCSATCAIETGWDCTMANPSVCTESPSNITVNLYYENGVDKFDEGASVRLDGPTSMVLEFADYSDTFETLLSGDYFIYVEAEDFVGNPLIGGAPVAGLGPDEAREINITLGDSFCGPSCTNIKGKCSYDCIDSSSCTLDPDLEPYRNDVVKYCSGKDSGSVIVLEDEGKQIICCGYDGEYAASVVGISRTPLVITSDYDDNYESSRLVRYEGDDILIKINSYE